MSLIRHRDINQTSSSFCVNMSESVCLSRNGISRNICWFHISNYNQIREKKILHFRALFGKPVFSIRWQHNTMQPQTVKRTILGQEFSRKCALVLSVPTLFYVPVNLMQTSKESLAAPHCTSVYCIIPFYSQNSCLQSLISPHVMSRPYLKQGQARTSRS